MRRSFNLILLLAGYILGQGGVFLAQTWLVGSEKLHFLALFGTHFSFAILASGIVDFGSATTLARKAAQSVSVAEVTSAYWATSAIRMGIAIVVFAVTIPITVVIGGSFGLPYALACAPGLVALSLNAGGVLDGKGLSGLSGLASSLPYIASATALPFSTGLSDGDAGLVLGAAFSTGMVGSALVTIWVTRKLAGGIGRFQTNRQELATVFRDGAGVLASWLPGQLFYRTQIITCTLLLGPAATGLFLYGKQIVNALSQFVVFVRRIEFPLLVSRTTNKRHDLLAVTRRTLWPSVAIATVITLGAALPAALPLSAPQYLPALLTVAMLSPVILSASIYAGLGQGFLAVGEYGIVATVAWATLVAGGVLCVALVPVWGVLALMFAELAAHLLGVLLLLRLHRRPWVAGQ